MTNAPKTPPQTPFFQRGQRLRVRPSNPSHPNKIGIFQFMGGPNGDIAVLAEPDNGQVLFYVGQYDLLTV